MTKNITKQLLSDNYDNIVSKSWQRYESSNFIDHTSYSHVVYCIEHHVHHFHK